MKERPRGPQGGAGALFSPLIDIPCTGKTRDGFFKNTSVAERACNKQRRMRLKESGTQTIAMAFRHPEPGIGGTSPVLLPFTGRWGVQTASHLLSRTLFGPTRAEITASAASNPDDVIDQLLADHRLPDFPADPHVPGRDWTNAPFSDIANINYQYDVLLKEWWIGLMLSQGLSIREKMTLLLHNHFASQAEVVRDARLMYRQNMLFRRYAVGNLRNLVFEITLDGAMLRYLNGYLNKVPVPDENYARELLELFTVGKENGGVSYTEDDVRSAARALTGWTVDRYQNPPTPVFLERNHDMEPKQFSAAFGNTRIEVTRATDGSVDGAREVGDLIDMIFRHPGTALSFSRKLYRWFVYSTIDDEVERNVIIPLASLLRESNFELRPVLRTLLRSQHFFDPRNVGCIIRNPVDLVIGSSRHVLMPFSGGTPPHGEMFVRTCRHAMELMGMDLLEPPNVAGWPAYHQAPGFQQYWINTTTLPLRKNLAESLVYGIRPHGSEALYFIDVASYASSLQDPGNPFTLVDEISADLLPPIHGGSALPPESKDYILYNVMGLVRNDEYEWTARWNRFRGDPNDQEARLIVTTTLKSVLRYILQLPEYNLI